MEAVVHRSVELELVRSGEVGVVVVGGRRVGRDGVGHAPVDEAAHPAEGAAEGPRLEAKDRAHLRRHPRREIAKAVVEREQGGPEVGLDARHGEQQRIDRQAQVLNQAHVKVGPVAHGLVGSGHGHVGHQQGQAVARSRNVRVSEIHLEGVGGLDHERDRKSGESAENNISQVVLSLIDMRAVDLIFSARPYITITRQHYLVMKFHYYLLVID
ncbi:hypothetical protein D3C87_1581850 [compost metagenome]